MNRTNASAIFALALATLVLAAGCSRVEPTAPEKDPTTQVETIDGANLPSAAQLTGQYPTAAGIDEFVPEPEPSKEGVQAPVQVCRGFRIADLLFGSGDHGLTEEGSTAISHLAAAIPDSATIKVTGHTDDLPIAIGNDRLSELRAESVAAALAPLLSKGQQIAEITGAGDREPIADNATEDGRRQNRRVEVLVNCGGNS